MGVLDRLRRRAGASDSVAVDAPDSRPADLDRSPAQEFDNRDSVGEQRGDFLMLPPMLPTFGLPVHLQQSSSDYLVTRRPMAVTNEPLTHGVSPEQLGVFSGRARRARGRMRPRRSELLHRLPESSADVEDLDGDQDLPPMPAPRRLSASPKPTPSSASADVAPIEGPSAAAAVLPSISDVRRVVTGSSTPAMSPAAFTAPDGSFAPPTLPPSSLTESSTSAPVLRRRASRGRVTTPIEPIDEDGSGDIEDSSNTPSNDELSRPPLTMQPSNDPELPGAPTAESMPPLTGGTRVRGSVPPSLTPTSPDQRPTLPDSPPIGRTSSDSADGTTPMPELPELINRTQAATDSSVTSGEPAAVTATHSTSPETGSASVSPAPLASAPAPASRPAEPSTIDSISPAFSRADGASTAESSDVANTGDAATTRPASALPSAPLSNGSRPTLGSRGSIVSPGTTGIQRRARDGSAPAATPRAMPASRSSSTASVTPPSASTTTPRGAAPSANGGSSASGSSPTEAVRGVPSAAPGRAVAAPSSVVDGPGSASAPAARAVPSAAPGRAVAAPSSVVDGPGSASAPAARAVPSAPSVPAATAVRGVSGSESDSSLPDADSNPDSAEGSQDQAPSPKSVPIPENVRRAVAKAVGDVPDTVLVHEGEHAESMTRKMNAEAFTRDGQIYLAGDAPLSSARGQELLAHELTHVVQQRGGTEPMPDESTSAGRDHESAALQVERAIASESSPVEPVELAHATPAASVASAPGEPSGAAPINVPQGVQRRGREYSLNYDPADDEPSAPAAVARPNSPASAPTRPDLVHLQKQQGKFEEVTQRNSNSTLTPRSLRPGSSSSMSGEYGHDATAPARVNEGRASMSSITGGTHFEGEDQRNTSGKPHLSSAGSEVKESSSMFSKGLSMFEKLTLPPADPFDTDDIDDRRADLERQAHSIYPFIRAKLRAELVKDRERRGRLAREWG